MSDEQNPRYYSVKEVATITGCSTSTLRHAMSEGKLRLVRIGPNVRLTREAVEAWLNRPRAEGPGRRPWAPPRKDMVW